MCKVSVIMGVYNSQDYRTLYQSVKSIVEQTFEDWEFIICNDGSTDDTLAKLKEFQKLDSRIKIISYNVNRGLSYALNKCIELAEGEYIARQDADDISHPQRLAKQVFLLETQSKFSFVGCNAVIYDEEGEWGEYLVNEYPCKKDFLWNNPFIHPSVIFRKEDLIRANCYRVAPETRRCEDYDLFMRMYALSMKGCNLQDFLYQYQSDRQQISKYRLFGDRFHEAKVRFLGFKEMNIFMKGIPYIFKPLLLGVIPQWLFVRIRFLSSNYKRL